MVETRQRDGMGRFTADPDIIRRFWAKVRKSDGCWEWGAGFGNDGYGQFFWDRATRRAHRVAWIIAHGDIAPGLHVLHRCDNPKCVRPDHLFLGTPADNTRDMLAKARNSRGESRPAAKLTESDVIDIRTCRLMGATFPALAAGFGVSLGTVWQVVAGNTWKHVPRGG